MSGRHTITDPHDVSYRVEVRRDPKGIPRAYLIRRARSRDTVRRMTAADLATLLAEAACALKIIEDHREGRTE